MSQKTDTYVEEQLVDLARAGDRMAFGRLVEQHQHMVYTLALRIVGQSRGGSELAEEVAQDAFIKAWQQLGHFQAKAKFSTWLYRITYTSGISALRRKRPETSLEEETSDQLRNATAVESAMDQLRSDERKQYLNLALDQLAEADRTVLSLFYLAENSIAEIEEITGYSKANIKVKLMRGRDRLYQKLAAILHHEVRSIL